MSIRNMILIMASTLIIAKLMYRQDVPTAPVLKLFLRNKTLKDGFVRDT